MAIVKVRVTLKDARTDAARSRAERVGVARFMTKRVGASLGATKSRIERVGAAISRTETVGVAISRTETVGATISRTETVSAAISRTETVGAAISRTETVGAAISRTDASISKDERLGDDRAKAERLGTDITRAETYGADIARPETYDADITRDNRATSERVGPYTARSKRAGPYTARSERGGPYTARSERAGPYTARSERGGPYTARSERVDPYTSRSERAGPYTARSERAVPYTARSERVGPYTSRSERVDPYTSRSERVDPYKSKVGSAKYEIVGADRESYERVDAYTARYESTYIAKVGRVGAFDRVKVERVGADRARYEKPRLYTSRVGRASGYTTRVGRASAYTTRAKRIGPYRARAGAYRARDDRGSVTLKLKRPRVDDFGNFPKRHRSVQNNGHEDHNSQLYNDLVKSSNLKMSTTNDQISQFSDRHVGIVKVTPRESFPLPLKDDSVKCKEDQNTSHQGLGKRQPLSDNNHWVICGSFDVSQQHVPYLEVKDRSEVKMDLKVLEDSSAKSMKQNWSTEYQHKTNIVSKNFATNLDSKNHHFTKGRKSQPYHQPYQPSMHVEFATKSSVELECKDRRRVRGALIAYQEVLSKFMAQKCSSRYVKAAMVLKKQGKWVNTTKQIGSIGGVKVGDKFLYRAQLNIVGLHRAFNNGIDYMRRNDGKILATSIVDSGRYVNNLESPDILIYSGQGGKSPYDKTEPKNQIMEGGNLALRNSQEEGTPIRVIRRLKRYKGSCYVYYGLYTVERVMEEREHGIMIYKFRLRRKPGQPELLFDSS